MVFSVFVTPEAPRTPAGGRACGKPSLIEDLAIRLCRIRWCARICAASTAYVRKFYWKSLPGYKTIALCWYFRRRVDRARKKRRRPSPQRAAVAGVCPSGHDGVLQTALMGLITALRKRNRPKWTSRAVSRGGFFATTQTQTTGFLVPG